MSFIALEFSIFCITLLLKRYPFGLKNEIPMSFLVCTMQLVLAWKLALPAIVSMLNDSRNHRRRKLQSQDRDFNIVALRAVSKLKLSKYFIDFFIKQAQRVNRKKIFLSNTQSFVLNGGIKPATLMIEWVTCYPCNRIRLLLSTVTT